MVLISLGVGLRKFGDGFFREFKGFLAKDFEFEGDSKLHHRGNFFSLLVVMFLVIG